MKKQKKIMGKKYLTTIFATISVFTTVVFSAYMGNVSAASPSELGQKANISQIHEATLSFSAFGYKSVILMIVVAIWASFLIFRKEERTIKISKKEDSEEE